jgi:hypothetical protein
VPDVRGVTNLAHFAVAHDIHAGFALMTYGSANALGDDFFEFRWVVVLASILRKQHIDNVLRPRQAPDVGGENTLGTQPHNSRSG